MKKWYVSIAIIVAAMFLPIALKAGGESNMPPPAEPIVIPDTKDNCGCP